MSDRNPFHKVEASFILTFVGVLFLFSLSIVSILIAPRFIDPSWTSPTSSYQVQMYEVADPHLYISSSTPAGYDLQFVEHVKGGFTLLGFEESDIFRFVAPKELEHYITRHEEKPLKLTSRLLLLRRPQGEFKTQADQLKESLLKDTPKDKTKISYQILELYDPGIDEAFVYAPVAGLLDNWVDESFMLLEEPTASHHKEHGVIYVKNPEEYRIIPVNLPIGKGWKYDPEGQPIKSLDELLSNPLGFVSRKHLIEMGEHIYAIEGCWYCHTDQTRTLIQDTVLNGSDSYPAPPSTANEYIYQKVTFPGTKRNGPDISRVGVKRPSRDWHKAHFWSPKTTSSGSIMPSFRHFFDNDPSGTSKSVVGVPNVQFEAIFQYLMTKGTRIMPPTKSWWIGKDPVQTKELIED